MSGLSAGLHRTEMSDVLIVGGGSSGMWAARRIKELLPGADVLIADKGPLDMGGLMAMCGGDIDAVMPDERTDDWVADLAYYWDGLCDQDELAKMLGLSYDRFVDYQRLGCQFFKNPDGSLKGVPQRGLPHCKLYPARLKGSGGQDMVRGLLGELRRLGVRRIGRTLVTDLVREDKGLTGAVGFDVLTGEFVVFRFRAVLIATGQAEWKPAYSQNTATGEGLEMAYRAGARVRNFEFVKVWNVPKQFTWEGQTTLLPLGAIFVNGLGEPIMDRYMPGLGANTDPHFVTRAMALEVNAGRGPIYMDLSPIRREDRALITPQAGWQLVNYRKLKDRGIDVLAERTEWVPHLQDTVGSLCADLHGRTGVPGLFAAGRARSIEPGLYIGGFAMCTTAVTGYLAGEGLAEYLRGRAGEVPVPDAALVEDLRGALFGPLGRPGVAPHKVLEALREILFRYDVCILKNGAALTEALRKLEEVRDRLYKNMTAEDPHYLLKLRETIGMMWAAELYLRASLERKESRAGHFRTDYPERDEKLLAWLTATRGDGETPVFAWDRVPVETYRHPVDRFYSDQFRS